MKDHREIGRDQDLFLFHELSPGSPIWLPMGVRLLSTIQNWMRGLLKGYQEIQTPIMWKSELFATSGHLDHFRENMYFVQNEDEEHALKPMNCPASMLVYKSRQFSYRDLPVRYADFGTLHRNETSGAIGGLTRCRMFHQDDAHIFLAPEQLEKEIAELIQLVKYVYNFFGMEIKSRISTRPKKFMGEASLWDHAESVLKNALGSSEIAEGEGAFYGPKIDFTVKDSLGREWQTATIQLDFQLPERFDLRYADVDNQVKRPVVIHRAILGSFERFIGVLLEHYQGKLPIWLAPIQAVILPISEKQMNYANESAKLLGEYRIEVDNSNETLGHKIALWSSKMVPYFIIVGGREEASKRYTLRDRDAKKSEVSLEELKEIL